MSVMLLIDLMVYWVLTYVIIGNKFIDVQSRNIIMLMFIMHNIVIPIILRVVVKTRLALNLI